MNEFKSFAIRKKILDLCNFFEKIVNENDVIYRADMNKTEAMSEISAIKEMVSSAAEFTLAFVGEYSAGKTTLIGLLTGKDLRVGSSVTTGESEIFSWHNITIVDTPGLGSGLNEHDQTTKEWLAKADLLVYVLTPDLFNSQSGKRFLDMLDEFCRDHELMLVMNMIDQEGNPVEIYKEALQSVLDPRPLESYSPCFISADYQKKSRDLKYSNEDREYFSEKSRYDTFIEALDDFIMERREKASLSTPLTRLQALSRKIGLKNEFDKENALLDLQISSYEEIIMELRSIFGELIETLKGHSSETTGNIFLSLDNPGVDLQYQCEQSFEQFSKNAETAIENACQQVADAAEKLREKAEVITKSTLFNQVQERISNQETLKNIFQDLSLPDQQGENDSENILIKLRENLTAVEDVSGINTPENVKEILDAKNIFDLTSKLAMKIDRKMILKIGHKIGYKFRPWEAVKLSSKVTKAVPFLNVAAVALDVISFIRGKKKQEERNKQLREFKQDVRSMIDKARADTETMFKSLAIAPIHDLAIQGLELMKGKKKQVIEYSEKNKEISGSLEDKRTQCLALYRQIYVSENANAN